METDGSDAARLVKDQATEAKDKAVKARPEALALIEAQAGGALIVAETEPIPSKVAAEVKAAADTSPTPLSPAIQWPASTVTLEDNYGAVVARYAREAEGGAAREVPPSVKEELKEVLKEVKEVKEVKEALKEEALLKEELKEVPPTLGQLKEVRELCRNRAENGSFLTLAALIACFSLGVLLTLKYDDKYYDVLNYAFSAQNLTKATPTEGCDPCAWLIEEGGTFLNHTLLAYTPRRYSSG